MTRGIQLMEEGAALRVLERVGNGEEGVVEQLTQLSVLFENNRQHDSAAAAMKTAAALNPSNPDVLGGLGRALGMLGLMSEASSALQAAVALAPQTVDHSFHLGSALRNLGRFDESETHYQTCLSLFPEGDFERVEQVKGLIKQGRLEKAAGL